MKYTIGLIGLGKMGSGLAKNLLRKDYKVIGFNRTLEVAQALEPNGLVVAQNLEELVDKLTNQKIIWTMLPAGEVTQHIITQLSKLLTENDIVINGANSHYTESISYHDELMKLGIQYIDVGFSGGPYGAEFAPCLMIGNLNVAKQLDTLWVDLVSGSKGGFEYFETLGAGHFVKMVHNGIEYGMMQSISEGLGILQASKLGINLEQVLSIYSKGSIVDSALINTLKLQFSKTNLLSSVPTQVNQSGEGLWTIQESKKLQVQAPIISNSVKERLISFTKNTPHNAFTNLMRQGFGGHDISQKKAQKSTKLFLDSGNPGETAKTKLLLGFLDGQTTNPSLIKNNPMVSHDTIIGSVCSPDQLDKLYKGIVNQINEIDNQLDLSVEIYVDESTSVQTIVTQAQKIASWAPNIRVKIPVVPNGLEAGSILCTEGIKLNFTLVFSQEQVAAVYNAVEKTQYPVFVSPFIGRLNDIGLNGLDLVKNCAIMLGENRTVVQLLAASVRTSDDLTELFGIADAITAPKNVYESWINQEKMIASEKVLQPIPFQELNLQDHWQARKIDHELTKKGLKRFIDDWNEIKCV
jgi:6-phosphogluconate dehydrogenase